MGSENGWEPARLNPGDPLLVWKTVPGTDEVPDGEVTLQVRNDDAGKIMLAYAADYHAFIEPLRDADSACYTPTNSVATSNHLNATAMDLNWNSHPFQVADAGYDAAKIARMRDLLAFYGPMFWANDWDSPKDSMHHQMAYDSYGNTADFVRTKIRADGFSTYKRGGTPIGGATTTPPANNAGNTTPTGDAATVLYDAVPVIDEDRAAQLVDAVQTGLAAAQCNNTKRIAMFLAQCGHESDGFATTEEYADGSAYNNRPDLGNTQAGDGPRFKGRTWIQITGRANYTKFSAWAASQGLISDPAYFVNNPTELADLKWAGIGAAWYWTVARSTINSLCDQGDLVGVTQLINGGQNGIDDRRARYQQAIALGDRLLLLTKTSTPDQGDDFMAALTPDEQREMLENLRWLRSQFDVNQWGTDSSMGQTDDGKELTVRDGLAELKRYVEDPKVAIVTFQTPATK